VRRLPVGYAFEFDVFFRCGILDGGETGEGQVPWRRTGRLWRLWRRRRGRLLARARSLSLERHPRESVSRSTTGNKASKIWSRSTENPNPGFYTHNRTDSRPQTTCAKVRERSFRQSQRRRPKMAGLNSMEFKSGQDYASDKNMMRLGAIPWRMTREERI